MKRTTLSLLRVHRSPLDHRRGHVVVGATRFPCALGRSGTTRTKREGDGASPIGRFPLIGAYFRPDRMRRPRTGLPLAPLAPRDGWCDAPGDRRYNRPVRLPYGASCEAMWREDRVYDVVVDIAWNRGPIRPGRGSAIFLHLARPGFEPTAGCVAVERRIIARLLVRVGRRTRIEIMG
jgi:L,D-peptidoglycan transpeptidase YkuD (ErfK/YbiS/YcfS/YnhG family)